MLNALIVTIHIIACVALVILVLLQPGKEGMGVIFGGSSSSMFGSKGAGGILTKLTIVAAVVFLITSVTFTYESVRKPNSGSVVDTMTEQPAPVNPAQSPAPVSQPAGN